MTYAPKGGLAMLLGTLMLFAGACAPAVKYLPPAVTTASIDFSSYSKRGFFFTPDPYSGQYETVGFISVIRYASARYAEPDQQYAAGGHWEVDSIPLQEAIDSMYARATRMGADAIMELRMDAVIAPPTAATPALPGLHVSGFAIRRLKGAAAK